jgi:uncharacterized protein (TIGR03067 family)
MESQMVRWLLVLAVVSLCPAVASEPCKPIDGIQPLLKPGKTLLLGEIHGTVESPAFALDVACHAARADLPVVVGLELSTGEQTRVDAFLESQGTEEDRSTLLAGPPWQRSYQDGRASRAMFDLIDGLRRLRGKGHTVGVTMFDAPATRGGQQRDRDMARNLAAVVTEAQRSMVIVLTGNNHSRITQGLPRNSTYEPMGYVLGRETSTDNLIALNVAHGGGSAWICAPDCGIANLAGRHGEAEWTIEIDDATRPAGHSGWYHVGSITAAPPARMSPSEVPLHPTNSTKERARKNPDKDETGSGSTATTRNANRPLFESEAKFRGEWQAYDFGSRSKTWAFRFEGRSFRAQGGPDDWYVGRVAIREDQEPAQIDFTIDDCRCSYKGMTSKAIYQWDDESLVISAPQPGNPRPRRFVESSGQMMLLLPLDGE